MIAEPVDLIEIYANFEKSDGSERRIQSSVRRIDVR